jgi:hypothetical protein
MGTKFQLEVHSGVLLQNSITIENNVLETFNKQEERILNVFTTKKYFK